MLSTASQMRCKAVVAPEEKWSHQLRKLGWTRLLDCSPMVMSVPAMSLSILPTRPTMLRCW